MVDVCNKMCEVWVLPRASAAFSSSCVGGNQPTSDTKPHTAVCNRIHNHKHRMYTLQCAPDCKHLEAQCPPNTPTNPPLIHSPPPRPHTLHKAHTRRCILLCVKCKPIQYVKGWCFRSSTSPSSHYNDREHLFIIKRRTGNYCKMMLLIKGSHQSRKNIKWMEIMTNF